MGEELSQLIMYKFGQAIMMNYLKTNKLDEAKSLVNFLKNRSPYCFIEMCLMFYSKTSDDDLFAVQMSNLLTHFVEMHANGQYQFEWFGGLFYVQLAELQIEFNQDDQFLLTLERLANVSRLY